jgi:hypothetical protein
MTPVRDALQDPPSLLSETELPIEARRRPTIIMAAYGMKRREPNGEDWRQAVIPPLKLTLMLDADVTE